VQEGRIETEINLDFALLLCFTFLELLGAVM